MRLTPTFNYSYKKLAIHDKVCFKANRSEGGTLFNPTKSLVNCVRNRNKFKPILFYLTKPSDKKLFDLIWKQISPLLIMIYEP